MTWNLQHGVPDPTGHPDLDRGLGPLAALHGDVVALQEVDDRLSRSGRVNQPRLVADHLAGELVWVPALRRDGGSYGVALVVLGKLIDQEVIRLPGGGEPRVAGIVRVEVGDRRWSVAATHLSTHDTTAARQLVAVFDALARHPSPRVLLGDLNLTPQQVLPHSTAEGYHLLTGPATIDARSTPTRRIDQILLQGASVITAGVRKMPLSDHLAVWADLA